MSGNKGGDGVQPRRLPRIEKNVTELESQTDHREKQNKILDEDDIGLNSAIKDGLGARNLIKKFGGGLKTESSQRAEDESQKRAQEAQNSILRAKAEREAKENADREKAEREAKENADREKAEREAEAKRKAQEEAEAKRKAQENAEREAQEEAEAKRKAKEEADRVVAKEGAEAEAARKAKEEADRKAKEEADSKAKEEASTATVATAETPAPGVPPPSWTFVTGPNSVGGEEDALTKLLKYIREHPEAQNHQSIEDFQNKDLPLKTSKMVADTAEKIPLRDLEFTKKQENGQTVYDVTLPNAQYTGPVFMPRLDENGSQAKTDDRKPAYDILYYNNGKLDPSQSFVAPEGTPPEGAKSTIKSADRQTILEESKKRDVQKKAGQIAQSLEGVQGSNPNSKTNSGVSSTRFYLPGR
jgi:hypothetical protein